MNPPSIGWVLERPCDVVGLLRGDLRYLKLRRRVEEEAEVLIAGLSKEDGDGDAVDFCDRETTLDDVTADELN